MLFVLAREVVWDVRSALRAQRVVNSGHILPMFVIFARGALDTCVRAHSHPLESQKQRGNGQCECYRRENPRRETESGRWGFQQDTRTIPFHKEVLDLLLRPAFGQLLAYYCAHLDRQRVLTLVYRLTRTDGTHDCLVQCGRPLLQIRHPLLGSSYTRHDKRAKD